MLRCDVVIPTFNNRDTLPQTLAAVQAQKIPPGWDVSIIVSDDGSRDNTVAWAEEYAKTAALPVSVLVGPHAGAGSARNRAVAHSQVEIIFLLGADIILRPQAVSRHLEFHERHPAQQAAALGFVQWDPRLKPSPLMEWLIHGGQFNDYDAALGKHVVDPARFFYGSHISVKRPCLREEKFSPAFQQYGWEDLELGRRLAQRGLQLYPIAAMGLHHHTYSFDAVTERQRQVGKTLHIYRQAHPFTVPAPRGIAHHLKYYGVHYSGILILVQWFLRRSHRILSTPRLFLFLTASVFWQGYHQKNG
jgi:glycosyltransferase involved in cell wall biosynthesis